MTDNLDRHRPSPAPPQPTKQSVFVQLWTFSRGGHQWSAALQEPDPWGFEVQILKNGKLRMSCRFPTRFQAVAWAAEERTALEQALTGI